MKKVNFTANIIDESTLEGISVFWFMYPC